MMPIIRVTRTIAALALFAQVGFAKPIAILVPLYSYKGFALGEIYHVAAAVAAADPAERPLILIDLRLGTADNPTRFENIEDFLTATESPDATVADRRVGAMARQFLAFLEQAGLWEHVRLSRQGLEIRPVQFSTALVAAAFRRNLELGRGLARGAMLGKTMDEGVRVFLKERLGAARRPAVGIFIRNRSGYDPDRNMTPDLLASLMTGIIGQSNDSALRIVLLGDVPTGPQWDGILKRIGNGDFGNRPGDIVNLTGHWLNPAFDGVRNGAPVAGDLCKQLQFFVMLYEEFKVLGVIGPKSGMLDGASFVSSMPIIEFARNPLDHVDNAYGQIVARATADSSDPAFANKVRGMGREAFIDDRIRHYSAEAVDEESRMIDYSAATRRPNKQSVMTPDFRVEPFPEARGDSRGAVRAAMDLLKSIMQFTLQVTTPVRRPIEFPCLKLARRVE